MEKGERHGWLFKACLKMHHNIHLSFADYSVLKVNNTSETNEMLWSSTSKEVDPRRSTLQNEDDTECWYDHV